MTEKSPSIDVPPPSFSTIGKDTIHWSFPRASRYRRATLSDTSNEINLPSTLEKRTTSFGYGKRWEPKNPKGLDAPSPDTYSLRTCFDIEKRGAFFTINLRNSPSHPPNVPGPGTYEVCGKASGPKFSMRPKLVQKARKSDSPPPGAYNPSYALLEKQSYSGISFGNRDRPKEKIVRPSTPGPGTYDIPSSFNISSPSKHHSPQRSRN